MNERRVAEVMQRELLTCYPNTPVDAVARNMTDYHVHALVVVDEDGYAVGIVSQTDLLLAHCQIDSKSNDVVTAGDIMSPAVIACTPETTIFEAVTTMTRNHIHRLVVVKNAASRLYPLGIVAMTDIIRYLLKDTAPGPPAVLCAEVSSSRN